MALMPENAVTVLQGQSKTLDLKVTDESGTVTDLTGGKLYFTVKKDIDDTLPLVQKTSDSISQIEITFPREGLAKIYIEHSDTFTLDPGSYRFDVWVVLASGKRYPVIPPSIFEIERAVTVIPL